MGRFIGRHRELETLRREFDRPGASLVVVYGRRRVGKSTLLQQAAGDGLAIYFQATRVDERANIEAFKSEIVRTIGPDPIIENATDWLTIFHRLAEAAERRPGLRVVIDEFPYLLNDRSPLPSVLQKFWDTGAPQKGDLKIVLCGSLIAHMEELLAERNPLYGRRTLAMELGPMSLREAGEFLPDYDAKDRIQIYSIFGGIPYYLSLVDDGRTVRDNVCRLVMDTAAPLLQEPEFLLQSELRQIRRYASIVAAVASGQTKLGEIVGRVDDADKGAEITPYLDRLARMRIIEKVRSLDAPPKVRDARYVLSDPLFRFWYRYVAPNASAISRGFGTQVYDQFVAPGLSEFMGPAFEDLCREHLRRFAQELTGVPAQVIGKVWSSDYDIDVAGTLLDGSRIYGECKWTNAPIDGRVYGSFLRDLEKAPYAAVKGKRRIVIFSKSGYAPEVMDLAERQGVTLLGPDDLAFWPNPALEEVQEEEPEPDNRNGLRI